MFPPRNFIGIQTNSASHLLVTVHDSICYSERFQELTSSLKEVTIRSKKFFAFKRDRLTDIVPRFIVVDGMETYVRLSSQDTVQQQESAENNARTATVGFSLYLHGTDISSYLQVLQRKGMCALAELTNVPLRSIIFRITAAYGLFWKIYRGQGARRSLAHASYVRILSVKLSQFLGVKRFSWTGFEGSIASETALAKQRHLVFRATQAVS